MTSIPDGSEDRFKELLQTIQSVIVWEATADTLTFTFVSEPAAAILGYPTEEWLSDRDFWLSHVHPDDRDAAASVMQELAANGGVRELDYRMLHADGRIVWLSDRVTRVNDPEGQPKLLRGVMVDVTGHRLAAEELQRSEQRFSAAFHSSPAAMTIARASDRVLLDANNAFVQTLGYSREELIGKSARELGLLSEADRDRMQEVLTRDGRISNMEMQLFTRDGRPRDIIGSAEIIQVAGEPCLLSLFYDVTDSKAAQQAVIKAENKYRSIFENAVFGVFQTTPEGRFLEANQSLARLLGYPTVAEMIAGIEDIGRDVHVDPHRRQEMAATLARDGEIHDFQCELRRRDGSTLWASLSARVVRDESGAVGGYEGIVEDITRHRRAQTELERRYSELEALHKLTVAINAVISAEDIHNEALNAVMNAVHPDRAALLIFDSSAVMRFKASRGLSEQYCAAVEGHSPWSPDEANPTPILVEDVSVDPSLDALREIVLEEGVHALAFIPLTAQGGLIGKFMLYYDTPHTFSPEEVQLAQTVANNLAIALARRSAEEAVRESELRYRGLIEGVGVAVYTTDAQGRITLYNEAAAELWGRRPVIGEDLWCGSLRLFHPDGTPMAHDECPMAITLKERRPILGHEALSERPDGTRVPFLPFPNPMFDAQGTLVGAVNVLVDISDRKRAEEALKAERERIDNIIASVPGVVFEVRGGPGEPTQSIEFVSSYAEQMLGYKPEEWTSDPDLWHRVTHPDDRERALDDARRTWAGEGGLSQYRVIARDGRTVWVEAQASVVRDSSGKAVGRRGVITDITLRKAADQAREQLLQQLQNERTRISNIISDVPGVVWEAYGRPDSAQQHIDFVSDYVEGMTGYLAEEWLATPNFWLTIVHPEDRERAAAEAAAVFNSGGSGRSEFRWVHKDGRVIWVDAQSTVIKDKAGEPIGMRGVTIDITTRKEAEEAARAVETQLSLVTNAIPALVSYVDADQRYVYNNEAYSEWFGEDPAALRGKHLRDVLGKKAYRAVRPYVEAALSGGVARYEQQVPYQSGGLRWVHAEYIPHRVRGRVAGFVALIHDISERVKAEEARRSMNNEVARRLNEETALNRIADLLRITLDLETICQVALSQATAVTRTEYGIMAVKQGQEGRVVSSIGLPDPALVPFEQLTPGSATQLARALFEGKAAFSPRPRLLSGSAKFMRESGATRFAVVPLIAHGAIVGAIEIASRSGRHWSKEDRAFLRRIADHIALAVSNAQAYQSIEDAFKTRDEGVRALAHEIRTPLTAIKGFSQLALRQVERGANDNERLRDSMEEIAAAAERLVRLAEDMLSASSVESGITRLRKERVSLGTFLRDAILEFTAEERPSPVHRKKSPRAYLEIDTQLIRQVVWNLLSNAMKHSPPGEPITIEAKREGRLVVISVSDRGPGVSSQDMEQLFEKFHTGGKDKEKGLGLGLYIARQIVEAHGGKIWCETVAGGGATFRFSLPVRRIHRER